MFLKNLILGYVIMLSLKTAILLITIVVTDILVVLLYDDEVHCCSFSSENVSR